MGQKQITARTAKGFRDFLPATMHKRQYVFDIIQDIFHLYGFEPLQTPILENHETLYGKYGEDAENLIFNAQHGRSNKEPLAMRYDLTVPLARVVAQYENELNFPFKRYQIAPVFRGERPQRGRYREFYQCDADIVGSSTMDADAELISMMIAVFKRLGFPEFSIKINNRKLLTGMGIYSGVSDTLLPELYRSIDKFDKIGADGVRSELTERGIPEAAIEKMMMLVTAHYPGVENLQYVLEIVKEIPIAVEGVQELMDMDRFMSAMGLSTDYYAFNFTMVRGLGYYTGPIFETQILNPNLGSISGGGRYDNLIGMFRKETLPTTGTSFGIERIIDLMDELDLYPAHLSATQVDAFVTVFARDTHMESIAFASKLREKGIRTEIDLTGKKLAKQFSYADKKQIPIVVIIGPEEIIKQEVRIKHLGTGEEIQIQEGEAIQQIQSWLKSGS